MKMNCELLGLAACGLALFTAAQSVKAITTSGQMAGNETWSGNIQLTGDVTVPSGVTLTILPGTTIAVWSDYDDQVGGANTSRIELIADNGIITAIGTSNNPILFTSLPISPPSVPGDWYGIRIASTTNGPSTFRYCTVEYGIQGVSAESQPPPVIDSCTFRHNSQVGIYNAVSIGVNNCLLYSNGIAVYGGAKNLTNCIIAHNNSYGVAVNGGIAYPAVLGGPIILQNCVFTNNSGNSSFAVLAEYATVSALSCTFANNGLSIASLHSPSGVYASGCVFSNNVGVSISGGDVNTVTNCLVVNNSADGIGIGNGLVVNSTFANNTGRGIVVARSCVVSNCVVQSNGGGGIQECCTYYGGSAVLNSTIAYNTGNGVQLSTPIVRGCSINDNSGNGVVVTYAGATVSGISSNRITGNALYDIVNNSVAAVLATNNYWGQPTMTELANNARNLTKVYDSQDNASVGQVIVRPYLTTDPFAVPPMVDPSTPTDELAAQGGTATFSVSASGGPLTYQWRKGTGSIAGATNSYLTLNPVQDVDARTDYNVIVSNDNGSVTSRWATLTVLLRPSITSQPTNLMLLAGSTAAFHVTATGSGPLGYQWYLGASPLMNGGKFSGVTSPDLSITSVQSSNVGSYSVVISNAVGSTNSLAASLALITPPIITTNPATQTVGAGAGATFNVSATGTAPVNYQWYFNGAVITGATGSFFNIPTASTNSVGTYQVVAWNIAGTNWSTTAALWLNALKMYAGVNAYGPVGSNCLVQYATNLNPPVVWTPLQTITIVTNPTVIIDYGSADQPRRFYQTLPQ
jgi:hypothetical protein